MGYCAGVRRFQDVKEEWEVARGNTVAIQPGYDCRHDLRGNKVACLACSFVCSGFNELKAHFAAKHWGQFGCGDCHQHFNNPEAAMKHCRSTSHMCKAEYTVNPTFQTETDVTSGALAAENEPHWAHADQVTGITCACGLSQARGAIVGVQPEHPSCGLAALAAARHGAEAGVLAGQDYLESALQTLIATPHVNLLPLDGAAAMDWLFFSDVREVIGNPGNAGSTWYDSQGAHWAFASGAEILPY